MSNLLSFDDNQSELVEIPVIIVENQVQLVSPEFKKLSPQVLADVAAAMDGIVGYLKVRARYELIEEGQHCTYKTCWRPAVPDTHRCDDHPVKTED